MRIVPAAGEPPRNEYRSAVVPFVDEDLWPVLGTADAWEAMRARVVDALKARSLELHE